LIKQDHKSLCKQLSSLFKPSSVLTLYYTGGMTHKISKILLTSIYLGQTYVELHYELHANPGHINWRYLRRLGINYITWEKVMALLDMWNKSRHSRVHCCI